MTTVSMRSYAGEVDLHAIVELLNSCEAHDRFDEGISFSELQSEFQDPALDLAHDLRLWHDADGHLVGFGQLWRPPVADEPEVFVWFKVHPESRGGLIEDEILAWGHERAAQIAQERGERVILRLGTRDIDRDGQALLERHGFKVVRYFLRLSRPLDEPIPAPVFPEGFIVRAVAGEQEAADWVAMYNEAFVDHWNFHPWTVEQCRHRMREPFYRPDLNLIAVAPDGTFAAFDWCSINPEENARSGRHEGWIGILGTRRGFRQIGLGRAMLLVGLQQLKDAGVDSAKLGVDAENPNGALQLYESVGFRQVYAWVSYAKEQ